MQHFPPDKSRKADPPTRGARPGYQIEQHRVEEEPAVTHEWLAHLAAGRIQVR